MSFRRAVAQIAGSLLLASASQLAAAELLMLEQPGCAWCARFNEEVAPAYAKTEEGRHAPLRRVDITRDWADDLDFVARERFTPTFVLIDAGREIDRLRGYPGDEFFWYLLGEMIKKLPAKDTPN